MPRTPRKLDTINLVDVSAYLNPPTPMLGLESPARLFMTDFLQVHPVTIPDTTPVADALNVMKTAYVRFLLVTQPDRSGEEPFTGAVTATDLNGPKVLAAMTQHEFPSREEVLVRHVMIDKEHIHGLDFTQVERATIGDVLETIKDLAEQHIMVIERGEGSCAIRGMFSTTNIAKALHIDFDVEPQARTFFELEQVIVHHRL